MWRISKTLRRAIVVAVLCLAAVTPAWGQIAFVQETEAVGGGATSGSVDTSGANFLVAFISHGSFPALTPSDSKGNTWVLFSAPSGTIPYSSVWYVANATTGSGHTFTNPAGFPAGAYLAFSGVATSSPADQYSQASGAGFNSSNAQPGSITPTENGELLITGYSGGNGAGTVDSGFTLGPQQAGGGGVNFAYGMAWKVQTTAAAENPLWNAGSFGGAVAIGSFKAGAGGGGPPPARMLNTLGVGR